MPPSLDLDFPYAAELEALWTWTRRQAWSQAELERAITEFMANSAPTPHAAAQQQQDLRFVDWFHFDRVVPGFGATPLALWLAATGGDAAQPIAHAVVGTFRVTKVVPHSQVTLVGLRDEATYRLKDKALTVGLQRGQLVFGRLYPKGKLWVAGASPLAVDKAIAVGIEPLASLAAIADGLTLERLLFKPR